MATESFTARYLHVITIPLTRYSTNTIRVTRNGRKLETFDCNLLRKLHSQIIFGLSTWWSVWGAAVAGNCRPTQTINRHSLEQNALNSTFSEHIFDIILVSVPLQSDVIWTDNKSVETRHKFCDLNAEKFGQRSTFTGRAPYRIPFFARPTSRRPNQKEIISDCPYHNNWSLWSGPPFSSESEHPDQAMNCSQRLLSRSSLTCPLSRISHLVADSSLKLVSLRWGV